MKKLEVHAALKWETIVKRLNKKAGKEIFKMAEENGEVYIRRWRDEARCYELLGKMPSKEGFLWNYGF